MIRKLLNLNGLSILSVVLYHASAYGFISMFWWAHRYRPVADVNFDQFGNAEYYGLRIVEQLVIFAIAAFIFVSGYFVAVATGKNKITIGWDIIFNRIKSLAIPFVVWSIFYLFMQTLEGARYSVLDAIVIIVTGKVSPPFYFVPMLIQLYLIAPILVRLIKIGWRRVLFVSGVVQIIVLVARYGNLMKSDMAILSSISDNIFFTAYIFWFVLGIIAGLNPTSFTTRLKKHSHLIFAATPILFFAGLFEWEMLVRATDQAWIPPMETLIDHFYSLALILSLFALGNDNFIFHNQIRNLGTKSYGIYLSHFLVLDYSARLIYHVIPGIMEFQLLFQPLLIIAGLGIPLLLMKVADNSFLRPFYIYVFGK